MKKLQMTALAFKTAKEAFRKIYRKTKAEKRAVKRSSSAQGVVPYDLKKRVLKKQLRGLKITGQAEFKASPGLKNRILLRIEKAKKEKGKFRTPVIYGKAYASDKKGKTMQIQPLTSKQRKDMKKEMAKSADRNYKKVRLRSLGYSKGKYIKSDGPLNIYGKPITKAPKKDILGKRKYVTPVTTVSPAPKKKNKGGDIKIVKTVARKLEKASKAHAGQSRQLKKIISKYV